MQCAICDDDYAFLRGFQRRVLSYCAKQRIACACTLFVTPAELLYADISQFEIVFLNVDSGFWDGINIAKSIREAGNNTLIIFVSSEVRFAPQGYGVGAFRYLLKDQLDETFLPAMDDALKKLDMPTETITIKNYQDEFVIPLQSIVFAESEKRKVWYHLKNYKVKSISCYMKLSDLEEVLKGKGFLRVHKSFLVNMQYIESIKNYEVYLTDGTILQTSRQNYKGIIDEFKLWAK